MDDARHSLQDEMARAIAASQLSPHVREILSLRFARSLEDLFRPLADLYGSHPDYRRFCRQLIAALVAAQEERPADLQTLDLRRDLEPDWFLREKMVGYVFYIDRFNGTLARRARQARLSRRAGRHLCPLHALPEAASGRQRRRLFGDGLPRDQPGARHHGRSRGRDRSAARARHERLHRPRAEPHRQGT